MTTAYVDESGTLIANDDQSFYTLALLFVEDTRAIEQLVRRLRRSLHRNLPVSELKAARSTPQVIRRLLTGLTAIDCEIYVVTVDKRGVASEQSESAYRAAMALVVQRCVQRHPQLTIVLDKRYTKHSQRVALEQAIRLNIAAIPDQVVLIEQAESWSQPGLQAADFVAWAVQLRNTANEDWAVRLITGKIVSEETVRGIKIAALPGRR